MATRFARALAATISAIVLTYAAAAAAKDDAPLKTENGRLEDLISRLASSDYVLGDPADDSRPYVDPGPALHAFRHLAAELAWGDVARAARQAEKLDFEVVKFADSGSGVRYYVLREDLSRPGTPRGWGSYIINPDSRTSALVEVPHPIADVNTPEIGGAVFERAQAKGYLLAGAHRLKADVPDLVDSIFHQVHMAWVGPSAEVAAWQIHGFALSKHRFPEQARVIASTGDGVIAPEVEQLDAMCENEGLPTYVFNNRPAESRENRRLNEGIPGIAFVSLAATTNEQGRTSRSLGGSFVHVELESSLRLDAAQRAKTTALIAAAMSAPAARAAAVDGPAVHVASYAAVDGAAPATADAAGGVAAMSSLQATVAPLGSPPGDRSARAIGRLPASSVSTGTIAGGDRLGEGRQAARLDDGRGRRR